MWQYCAVGVAFVDVIQAGGGPIVNTGTYKRKKTFCARVSLMSHKIGNTWPIDAKNALLNA